MSLSWGSLLHFPIVCLALRDRGTTNPYLLWVQHLDNQCMIDKLHFHCYWIPKTGYLETPDISCCISSLSAVICLIETVECFRSLMPFYSEALLRQPDVFPHLHVSTCSYNVSTYPYYSLVSIYLRKAIL